MGGVVLQLWFPRSDLEQPYNDTKRPLRLKFEVRPSTSSTEFSQNLTSDSLLIGVFCTGCEPEIVLPTLKIKQKTFYVLDLDRTWTYNLLSYFCLIEETIDPSLILLAVPT